VFLLTHDPIETALLKGAVADHRFGAILLFEGVTRNHFEGRQVKRLEYEAYGDMAQAEMERIRAETLQAWPDIKLAVAHRLGVVGLGETSLIIAVGAPHRVEGYEASRFVLEAIKSRLPVWKKEHYTDGESWKANT